MSYSFVNGYNANNNAGAAQTTSFTLAAGQSIILIAADVNNNSATLTVTDTLGNTYVQRGTFNDPDDGGTYQLWDCMAPTHLGSNQVSSSSGSAGFNNDIQVLVYTGLASYSASSFVTNHSNSQTGSLATTAITPSSYPAMVLCVTNELHNATAPTVGTGFNGPRTSWSNYDGGIDMYTEDIAVASGTQTGNWSYGAATTSVILLAAAYIQSAVVAQAEDDDFGTYPEFFEGHDYAFEADDTAMIIATYDSAPVGANAVPLANDESWPAHEWGDHYEEPLISDLEWSGPIQPNAPPTMYYGDDDQWAAFFFDDIHEETLEWGESYPVGPNAPPTMYYGDESEQWLDDWVDAGDFDSDGSGPVGPDLNRLLTVEDAWPWAYEDDGAHDETLDWDSQPVGADATQLQYYGDDAEQFGDDTTLEEFFPDDNFASVNAPVLAPTQYWGEDAELLDDDWGDPYWADGYQQSDAVTVTAQPVVEDSWPHFEDDVGEDESWWQGDGFPLIDLVIPPSQQFFGEEAESGNWDEEPEDFGTDHFTNYEVSPAQYFGEDAETWTGDDDAADEWWADEAQNTSTVVSNPLRAIEDGWDHFTDEAPEDPPHDDNYTLVNAAVILPPPYYGDDAEWFEADGDEDFLPDHFTNYDSDPLQFFDEWTEHSAETEEDDDWWYTVSDPIPVTADGTQFFDEWPEHFTETEEDEDWWQGPPDVLPASVILNPAQLAEDAFDWWAEDEDQWPDLSVDDGSNVQNASVFFNLGVPVEDAYPHWDDAEPEGDEWWHAATADVNVQNNNVILNTAQLVEDAWPWADDAEPEDNDWWIYDTQAMVGLDAPPLVEDAWPWFDDAEPEDDWWLPGAGDMALLPLTSPPEDSWDHFADESYEDAPLDTDQFALVDAVVPAIEDAWPWWDDAEPQDDDWWVLGAAPLYDPTSSTQPQIPDEWPHWDELEEEDNWIFHAADIVTPGDVIVPVHPEQTGITIGKGVSGIYVSTGTSGINMSKGSSIKGVS